MRSAARALLAFLVLYTGFYALMANLGPLAEYPRSQWNRCPVVCTAALMPSTQPPVFFLASSNLNELSPDWVQYALPDRSVRFVYIGGIRVLEMAAMSRLLSTRISAEQRRNGTVVIGLWYGAFTPPPVESDSLDDMIRMPLQATKMYANGVYDWLFNKRRRFIKRGGLPAIDPNIEREVTTISQQQAVIETLRTTYSSLLDDGFSDMGRIINQLRESGYKVLLVDLPLPKWHQAGHSELIAQYQDRIAPVIEQARRQSGVSVLDLTSWDRDEDFRDHTHPTQAVAALWRDAVVAAIRDLDNTSGH